MSGRYRGRKRCLACFAIRERLGEAVGTPAMVLERPTQIEEGTRDFGGSVELQVDA